jgi:WD40 repeat protein
MVYRFSGPAHSVFGVAFSPDGKFLAAASLDGSLRLWNTSSFAAIAHSGNNPPMYDIAFSPDGQSVLTGAGGGEVSLWRIQANQ